MSLTSFYTLANLFSQHGFNLWLVGGSSRDYLLGLPLADLDLTTDAKPSEMKLFIPNANFRFAHYGTVQLQQGQQHIDITTLRQETVYQDKRHPDAITFIKDPRLDFPRRDLTINALYITSTLQVLDYVKGQDDLKAKVLRMIGEPYARLQEDPLRILRVLRFQHRLGFTLEPTLAKALVDSLSLLDYLNPAKVNQELKKMMQDRPDEAALLLASYGIDPGQR